MRAVYYQASGGPENLRLGERPDPVLAAGQLLVRTHAAGVGIWDVKMMARGGGQAPLPRIPGCEVAGTVEVAAGGFSAGDRIFSSLFSAGGGGFAEIAAIRVDKAAVIPASLGCPRPGRGAGRRLSRLAFRRAAAKGRPERVRCALRRDR